VIALIQRVTSAEVVIAGETVGRIGAGMLALIGVQKEDGERNAERIVERMLGYRIFQDADDRMNLSLRDVSGGLLLVPQFTLAADTRKGTRAGFSTAAAPARAEQLFLEVVRLARARHDIVETGRFGAEMSVSLVNHGPVTFWLDA
jgi:D-tyrosyl-tRNA(Tyr) deacylase